MSKNKIAELIKFPVRLQYDKAPFGKFRVFIMEAGETDNALCQVWDSKKGELIVEAVNSYEQGDKSLIDFLTWFIRFYNLRTDESDHTLEDSIEKDVEHFKSKTADEWQYYFEN